MAIVSVEEIWEGRRGSADFGMRRTYARCYLVYTDTRTEGPVTAGTAPGSLPAMGDPHPEDPIALVSNRSAEQDPADPFRWNVTIEYDTQPGGGGKEAAQRETLQPDTSQGGGAPGQGQQQGQRPENPLMRPARWSGGFQTLTEVLRSAYVTDAEGRNTGGSKPVANSAGMLFDPPVMVEVSRPTIRIQKNYSSLWLRNLVELQDAVNSTAWKGFDPFTVRCVGLEWEASFENQTQFFSVTYNLAVRAEGWQFRVLDAGLYERIQTGTDAGTGAPIYELRAIKDKHGEPIKDPVPLNGEGRRLQPNQPEVYLLMSGYKQRNFNQLILNV